MVDELVDRLKPSSPRHLLEELAQIGATLAKHDRPRPEIELYLNSGQVVRGRLISVADTGQGASILVQVGGNPKAPSVTYVQIDRVTAITVVDAGVLAKPLLSDAPVPSRLELQRQMAARADAMSTLLGRPIAFEVGSAAELDDDGRRALGLAFPILADVMMAIAGDAIGRDALGKLDAVELASSSDNQIRLEGRRLVIHASKLLNEQHTHATLRRTIEKLL